MYKKFKFDHANKWYMHNPAPVLKNDTHKLLWDFHIQTDHLISARRPNDQKQRKKICKIIDFAVPVEHRIKLKECEKRDKYLDLPRELKNYGIWRWQLYQLWLVLWHGCKRIIKGPGRFGSWRPSGDHPNNSIIENGQYTENFQETWGDLLSLNLQWKTISLRWCQKL